MTTLDPTLPAPPVVAGRARTRALLGISLGYFMVLLDMTVLSVAEPDLARSLGSSVAGLQWAVSGYTVVFGALLLTAGAVADRFGAHRSFRVGITAFGVGSLLCAWAPDLWTLVALRGFLGVAAAACVPASMAIITVVYPVPAERAKAVAVWAALSGAALAVGPIAGGLLVDLFDWRAIFLINVPIAAATLALTAGRTVVCPRGERAIDWTSQVAACAALALGTDALIAAGSGTATHAAWSAGGTLVAGLVFVGSERRSASPVLQPAILRSRGTMAALFAGAAVNFTMAGVLFVLPLLFRRTLELTPLETGLAFLPMTLPFAFNPLLTGRIVARSGARLPMITGLALLSAGGLVFTVAVLTGSAYPMPAIGLVCTGFGVSFALPALVTTVITTAPEGTAGAAGGLLNAVRQIGATIGVAAMGAFVTVGAAGDSHDLAYALLLPTIVCAIAGVAVAVSSRRSRVLVSATGFDGDRAAAMPGARR
ncbi:MFS transporter [Embleya sp. NBC_00896]|uniref:MFS transporter n=1 Tax=Embleya sp. NBC_00896 TaxID=2975961 RepID=UPI002F9106D6|nr:MFS transporter [Embleya sp. NBC_00896]